MPTYPYKCHSCTYEWDIDFPSIQKHQQAKADKTIACPNCKLTNVSRLIDEILPIQYKDFGFFTSDNKSDKELKRREKEKERAKEKKYY